MDAPMEDVEAIEDGIDVQPTEEEMGVQPAVEVMKVELAEVLNNGATLTSVWEGIAKMFIAIWINICDQPQMYTLL